MKTASFGSILLIVFLLCGPTVQAAGALYDDLGGKEKISLFTDDFVETLLKDDRTKSFFTGIKIPRLKTRLAEQFCQLAGGPVVYTGRDMKKIHDGLDITEAAFNALVEDLQDAMDRADIPFFTQNRLLALLGPMERDIVTK